MNNQASIDTPKDPERKQRILFAALSGFISGTIAAIASSYINVWLFPDLPIHLEWTAVFIAWFLWAFLGSVLAGLAGLSSEGWKGIFLSALGITFVILLYSAMQSSESMLLRIVSVVGLLFPIAAMITPLAFIFFWLARRFVRMMPLKGWARWKIILINSFVIIAIGMIPGFYSKMSARTEQGVRLINGILQSARTSSPDAFHKSLLKTIGFSEHKDQPYTLSQAPSVFSTVGMDVTVHYKDDYKIICTVVLYPGRDPAIFPCKGILP